MSFPSGSRGWIALATILSYALNFYCCVKAKDVFLNQKLRDGVLMFATAMSLGVIAMSFSGNKEFVFFPNKNLFCSFLNCGILAGLARWQDEEEAANSSGRLFSARNSLYFACLAIMALAQLMVYSIGAMLALFAGVMAFSILRGKKVLIPMLALLGIATAEAVLFYPLTSALIEKAATFPANFRLQVWQAAWTAFLDRPWGGWGLGNFEISYDLYKISLPSLIGQYEKSTAFAHNEILQIAVVLGLPGLAAIVWGLFIFAKSAVNRIKSANASLEDSWALASIAALGLHSFLDFNLHLPLLGFLFSFFASRFMPDSVSKTPASLKRYGLKALLWVLILAQTVVLTSQGLAAFKFYEAAALLNPWNFHAQQKREDLSSSDEKLRILQDIVRRDPQNHQPRADLARFFFQGNRIEESLAAYNDAQARNPRNPFYAAEAGDAELRMNRLNQALLSYQKAAELEPFYAFAHYRLGEIYLAAGNKPAAIQAFENVLKIEQAGLQPNSDYSRRLLDFDAALAQRRLDQLKRP